MEPQHAIRRLRRLEAAGVDHVVLNVEGNTVEAIDALDDRLREIGYGVWEGSTLAEMQAADPVLYARRLTAKWTMAPEGGETYAEVQDRMRDWYDSCRATPSPWPMAAPRGR